MGRLLRLPGAGTHRPERAGGSGRVRCPFGLASLRLYERWYTAWSWRARAEAWDEEQRRLRHASIDRRREEMAERHARVAVAVLARATRRLLGDPEEDIAALDPNDMGWPELLRCLEVMTRAERLARGEPTERAAIQTTVRRPLVEPALPLDGGQGGAAGVFAALVEAGVIELPANSPEAPA